MRAIRFCLPGLSLVTALLASAALLHDFAGLGHLGLSVAALGILLGVVVGNLWPGLHDGAMRQGIIFAQKHVLRTGIVLFGFQLSLQQLLVIGRGGLVVDLIMVLSTLWLGVWLGRRVFGLDMQTALLTAVGSAICGAAAIAATAPLLKASTEKVTAAVGTVVLFGTLGMGLYPLLNHLGPASLQPIFGIYVGSTVHEVAQVVAIGNGLDASNAEVAVIVKMLRVLMLMPFLLALGLRKRGDQSTGWRHMPWFALGFVAAAALNSLHLLSDQSVHYLQQAGALLLAAAMTAFGLGTTFARIHAAGAKPLLLGGLLFVYLVIGGGLVNAFLVGLQYGP